MGTDTKGVVLTQYKDVLAVCSLVERAITKVVNEERELVFPGKHLYSKEVTAQFASPNIRLTPESGMASVTFKLHGESRDLMLFFTCDCDHTDLAPQSLSMSLGCWGSSDILMKTVLHALSLLGPAYFDHNDCDDTPMAPLGEFRPNLLQAVLLGYVSPIYLDKWYGRVSEIGLTDPSELRQFLGASPAKFNKAFALQDFEEEQIAVKALAQAAGPLPRLNFMEDYHEEMASGAPVPQPKLVAPLRKSRKTTTAALATV